MSNPTGTHSAPPACKKARKLRGKFGKSHEGDQPPSKYKIKADVTPSDYLQIISRTELKDEEKLPCSIMTQWKAANDQDNFSKRIHQGNEVHSQSPVTKFMKANYINICQSRSSKEPSTDSLVIVPDNSWEDPNA